MPAAHGQARAIRRPWEGTWVGDQLDRDGQALALLHAEPASARDAHQAGVQRLELHQLLYLWHGGGWGVQGHMCTASHPARSACVPCTLHCPWSGVTFAAHTIKMRNSATARMFLGRLSRHQQLAHAPTDDEASQDCQACWSVSSMQPAELGAAAALLTAALRRPGTLQPDRAAPHATVCRQGCVQEGTCVLQALGTGLRV